MSICIKVVVLLSIISSISFTRAQEPLPFSTQKLLKDYNEYKKDIRDKATQLIEKKRLDTIKALEKQSNELTKRGNNEMARTVLELASALSEGKELSGDSDSISDSTDNEEKSWVDLFSDEDLPKSWIFTEDPDGGWNFKGGVLLMKSIFEDSVVLHDAPEGNLVVKLKVKIDDNENKENESERKHVGVGFINSRESLVFGYLSLEGNAYGYTNINPEIDLGYVKSGVREGKFADVQLAWVGTYFLMFVNDKMLIKSDLGIERGTAKISLMTENCFSSFSNVHHMKPNLEDLKRLASGKPLK